MPSACIARPKFGPEAVAQRLGRRACLATVLAGDDPSSTTYVRMKQRRCAAYGLESRAAHIRADARTDDVIATVRELDQDPTEDGILIQHPAPDQIDERAVFETVSGSKDVDGVTQASFAAMSLGTPGHHS